MKFTVEIECDNAAFADEPYEELARILRELADDIEESCSASHPLRDINGNRVGHSAVEAS